MVDTKVNSKADSRESFTPLSDDAYVSMTPESLSTMYQDFVVELQPVTLMELLNQYGLKANDVKGEFVVNLAAVKNLNLSQVHATNLDTKQSHAAHFSSGSQMLDMIKSWPPFMSWLSFNQQTNALLLAWLHDYKSGFSLDIGLQLLHCLILYPMVIKNTAAENEGIAPDLPQLQIQAVEIHAIEIQSKFQCFMMHLLARTTNQLDQYKLNYIESFDVDTNLPNQQLMFKLLQQRMHNCQASTTSQSHHFGLIVINLNINYDEESQLNISTSTLVRASANMVQQHINDDATLFRLGASELGILVEYLNFPAQLNLISARLANAFESALPLNSITLILNPYFGCTGSFGMLSHKTQPNAVAFYEQAKLALNHAILRNYQIEVYDQHIKNASSSVHAIDEAIIEALQQNELVVFLQPIITLPREICLNAEVLLRWQHPEWHNISATRLVDTIYKKGFGRVFIRWLINTACQAAASLLTSSKQAISLTINLSVTDLLDADLPELLMQSITLWDISANHLIIEITESDILVDEVKAAEVINKIVAIGCKFALDDFGTGYSSMARLRNMPIDFVKIDQSFVRNIVHSPEDREIVQSVVKLAHSLGKQVVAEGVEDHACLDLLKAMQCEKIQGYVYAKPMAYEDFEQWITRHNAAFNAYAV